MTQIEPKISPEEAKKLLLESIDSMSRYMVKLKKSAQEGHLDPLDLDVVKSCAEDIATYAAIAEWKNVVDWTPYLQQLKSVLEE
ncbi:hypothetical protein FD723_40310 (plasmid) [Nostoc sp. C052]|uniref:hypothetical protein n=1 Tax=Nostoc sp. C052 TaxID=2576902 RepID=UPI0015C2C7AA|nr:hypothetical protein [Nostoc sp. C052]QLE46458.1 hypothetical protein FD723_40310 [Nostoc sp. C052]